MQELEKKECKGIRCEQMILQIPRFNGMYCNDYCCCCCPDSKTFTCQKEKKEDGPIESLNKLQNSGENDS